MIGRILGYLALGIIFSTIAAAGPDDRPVVISGLSDYAPVMWAENGKFTGIAPELAQKVFEELDVPCLFRVLPFKRALQNASSGKIDLIAGLYMTDERKASLKYSTPFMIDPGVLFVRKGKFFDYRSPEDLVGRQGILNRGYSWGEAFDRFIEQRLSVYRVEHTRQGFQMLVREDRDIDYYLYGLIPGLIMIQQLGISDRIDYLEPYVTEERFYFAFSKKSEFLHLLPDVNRVIGRLVDEKYVEYLTARFMGEAGLMHEIGTPE